MIGKEEDRRTQKTREAIQESLYSLMLEKQYSKITIQDIIDRANVGRSTFYSHFNTKDELLMHSIKSLLEMLNNYIISYVENLGERTSLLPVVELFEHIKENSRIIKGLIRSESSGIFFDQIQIYWNKTIEDYLTSKLPVEKKPKVPIAILTNHITSSFISMLKWWLDHKMLYSPSEMEQYFQELVNPCIDSILPDEHK